MRGNSNELSTSRNLSTVLGWMLLFVSVPTSVCSCSTAFKPSNGTKPTMRLQLTFALFLTTLSAFYVKPALACSFGPIDKVQVGYTANDVLSAIYNSCGGEVTINRTCGDGGCDETEASLGQQFELCSRGGRYPVDRCVLLRNGRILSVY